MKLEELTPRHREVVQLLAQGFSNAEIALTLGITLSTVKNHLARICDQTGSSNRMRVIFSFYRTVPK